MDQPSDEAKLEQMNEGQAQPGQDQGRETVENKSESSPQKSLEDEKQRLRHEREKDAELNDAFGYYDRKRQGKLPVSMIDDVVSMLGITLPPTDRRGPLIKLADPQGMSLLSQALVSSLQQL